MGLAVNATRNSTASSLFSNDFIGLCSTHHWYFSIWYWSTDWNIHHGDNKSQLHQRHSEEDIADGQDVMKNIYPENSVQMAFWANNKARGNVGSGTNQAVEIKTVQANQDDGQHAKPTGCLRQQLA